MRMFSIIKKAKYYEISEETFESCFDIIQEGNDRSLSAVVVINAIFYAVMVILHAAMGRSLIMPVVCSVAAVFVAVLFFALRDKLPRKHHIFYYLAVQIMLFYSVYLMSWGLDVSVVLYPAIVMLLPLFYMHNMISLTIFYSANAIIVILLGYLGPEQFHYLRHYVFVVALFTVIGLAIHYVYQSNRLRELINYRESNEKQNALEISSNFDAMTRLLRRNAFINLAEHCIANRKKNQFMVVGILDIDHFKLINDTYGHQLGDDTISTIGRVMAETLDIRLTMPEKLGFKLDLDKDYGNIAGRLGGDEFIFLINSETNLQGAKKLTQYLLDALNATSIGTLTSIGGSIGISVVGEENKSYDELYHEADTALYSAKTNGRNKVMVYHSEMEKEEKGEEKERDDLTGLLLAQAFKEYAASFLSGQAAGRYAIVAFDIENFKSYNSLYGFEKGDQFLQEVASQLSEVYPGELLARFSDDHFVALLPFEDLEYRIGRIKYNLKKYSSNYKNSIRVGVYELTNKEVDINAACDRAKFACDMMRGRYDLQVQFFDEQLHSKRDRFQYIVEHLDEAITKEWIKVYYQPIVRTYTGEFCGLEALARWQDPMLGLLPPSDFIETLEQTRLIYKLDLYMVRQVCKNYRRCQEDRRKIVPVSVNLSRLDFESIDVVSEIENIIQEYDVPRHALHIEITESALVEQEDELKRIVDQFQKMDYQIWMDDFGSGYSSLNVLKDYHFSVIKFDMEFMRDTGIRARVVLTSIVDMAKKLGFQTLAEGVETQEQYDFLKTIGCEFVQGYWFSKPVPLQEFYQNVVSSLSEIENIEERDFYNQIGRINVLENVMNSNVEQENYGGNSKAVAIFEWRDDRAKVLMMSPSYMRFLRKDSLLDMAGIEEMINERQSKISDLLVESVRQAIASQKDEKHIQGVDGARYVLYMKCIAHNAEKGKYVILSSFTDISNE